MTLGNPGSCWLAFTVASLRSDYHSEEHWQQRALLHHLSLHSLVNFIQPCFTFLSFSQTQTAQCPSQMLQSRQSLGKSLVYGSSITLKREKSPWLQTQVMSVELGMGTGRRRRGELGHPARTQGVHACMSQERLALAAPRSHFCHTAKWSQDTGPKTMPYLSAGL